MKFDDVIGVADAVLYEGYALYPYRATSLKNRVRFTSGGVYPRAYSQAQTGADRCSASAECLLRLPARASLSLKLRFLQLGAETSPGWQDAAEREVALCLELPGELRHVFAFGGLRGELAVSLRPLGEDVFRLRLEVHNHSDCPALDRDLALGATLLAAHVLLGVEGGEFVSLLEPPAALAEAARACEQLGLFPVLVGKPGSRDRVLCSPIILYDHPQTAAQSPGDLFDATEIDEILSLRILTMTDEEKDEARRGDARVRALLERTESLDPASFERLHGVLRGRAGAYKPGDRVRLRPRRRADIFDLALAGKIATVRSVEHDFEDRIYLSVTVEDDPGEDLGVAGQPGHRFFFGPDEVEALEEPAS